VICVNRAGSTPPVSADLRDPISGSAGTATTTGANALNVLGYAYIRGLTLSGGSGATGTGLVIGGSGAWGFTFDQCRLVAPGTTGSASKMIFGNTTVSVAQAVLLDGTTLQFGAVTDSISPRNCHFSWVNTPSAIQGGTLPANTALFGSSNVLANIITVEGVDLSALGSGKTLVVALTAARKVFLKDCKLGSSVTVAATPGAGGRVDLIRCDSGDTNYRHERYAYEGTQTTETTVVRTGGASDGTTPISWKLITTANSKRYLPFEAMPISIWNETTGSPITLTVEGIWGSGSVPTDADIWMDVEYLGTSGFPLGNFASSGPADQLAAGTNLGAGSGTWGGSTTKFKLEKQITPAEKGPITVYIKAAAASSTFYIDPKIAVS
jgi:hypothetical protein